MRGGHHFALSGEVGMAKTGTPLEEKTIDRDENKTMNRSDGQEAKLR
jgi:hypothetical protein